VTTDDSPLIRDISDTALWVAYCRSIESERPDAIFRDPLARRLAGDRGREIEEAMQVQRGRNTTASSIAVRTATLDQMILERLAEGGIDTVINLAAGLDTRPYRLALPPSLTWIEVDLPSLIAFKEARLAGEKPVCDLHRVALDLADVQARRDWLSGLRSAGAIVLTEGLLIYLEPDMVAALADDLAAVQAIRTWFMDLTHPRLLAFLKRTWDARLAAGGATLKFAPEEGPEFFSSHGWKVHSWRSLQDESRRLERELPRPLFFKVAMFFAPRAKKEEVRRFNRFVRLERLPGPGAAAEGVGD